MLTNCLAACTHLTITVSEIERDIGRNSKVVNFSYPVLFDARRNIGTPFGTEKLEWCRYPMVEKISKISLFVLAQLMNVTDALTDGNRVTAYAYASRGEN